MTTPTQSTPGGCFVGALAIFPGGVTVLGPYGLYNWAMVPVVDRHFDDQFWWLVRVVGIGLLATLGVFYLSYRMLKVSDLRNYDSRNTDEPSLKW